MSGKNSDENAEAENEMVKKQQYTYIKKKKATNREEPQKNPETYRAVFEHTGTATCIIGEDTTLLMVNAEFERLSGYSRQQLEGKRSWTEFVVEEDLEKMKEYHRLRRTDPGKAPREYDFRFRDSQGKIKDVHLTIDVIPETKRSVASLLDITEQKKDQQQLESQLYRIKLLNAINHSVMERQDLESIYHVILKILEQGLKNTRAVLLTSDTTGSFGAVFYGPGSNQIDGLLTEGEMKTARIRELIKRSSKGEVIYRPDLSKIRSSIAEKLTRMGIQSLIILPVQSENKTSAILIMGRSKKNAFPEDETLFLKELCRHLALAIRHAALYSQLQDAYDDLRQTQKKLIRQERLNALGQMASGIAHDISNSLSPIRGYTDLLMMKSANFDEKTNQYLELIRTAALDIEGIVQRMQEFYKQREDTSALQYLDLNEALERSVQLSRARWKDLPRKNGINIHIKIKKHPSLPPIQGIASEVRQALVNLIINSVDAMPRGGAISLCSMVKGENVVVEVTDNGDGMDQKTLKQCLDPFFTTKGKKGSGLGLSIVYGIMQRHSGDLEIDSQPGKGTTVRLIFPSQKAEAQKGIALKEQSLHYRKPFSSMRILVIDDDPSILELLKEMLETEGHTVEAAEEGEKGINIFSESEHRGSPFDIVFTDQGMPEMVGTEVISILKKKSPSTPVVLLTGWHMELVPRGGTYRADAVIQKPPKLEEIKNTLISLCVK
ncbi:MAG: PAS domain S-box protein [Spirochaetota bacterium]